MTTDNNLKEFVIAQEFIAHGVHYYTVKAKTMGEAVAMIDHDPDLLPYDSEVIDFKPMAYVEAEDNYDG